MAFQYVTSSGQLMIIPDSAVNTNVITNPTGIATSGVVAIVGEADEGPSWSQDLANGNKLSANAYGPTDIAAVVKKYGSGNIVDCFRAMVNPSASTRINGGPSSIIIAKSNSSSFATLNTSDNSGYFQALRGGVSGDSIQESIASSNPEQAPSTGEFSYIPSASSSSMAVRVNGGTKQTLSIAANEAPSTLAAAITGLNGLNVVGGVNIGALTGLAGQNIQVAVLSGQNVSITLATPNVFAGNPSVGDTINIPSGSVIEGSGSANVGWYLVTSVTNLSSQASITATKITSGAPVDVAPVAISGTPANDMVEYSGMEINNMSGTNRNILTGLVGQSVTVTVVGSVLTATLAAGQVFASNPYVGDIVYIPSGSAYAGSGSANVGWYQVVTFSNTTAQAYLQMTRLSNGNPVAVSATNIAATTDIQDYDPQIKGIGKSLEIYDNAGSVNISALFYQLGMNLAASWPQTLLVSSSELMKTITLARNSTNSLETWNAGGTVVMSIGYNGTTASCTIGLVGGVLYLTTSVSGGSGGNLSYNLSTISTISDLVSKINSNTGYSASIVSSLDGQRNPSTLDQTTFTIDSSLGNQPGRVKNDLYSITGSASGLNTGSALADFFPSITAGLPADNAPTFLSNGSKGGSTGLAVSQAIDALQGVRCNFVVPLISQDASADIALGETDSSSTYTVDAVNAAVKSHVLAMSTATVKRHRIGIVSKKSSFAVAQASARMLSTFRIAHVFQDIVNLNSQGQLETFQPWMGAAMAAGMQAAGQYKAIFPKALNLSGVKHLDYDDENVTQTAQALQAGLIPICTQDDGTLAFASDQMTYGLDNNFVYNSLQAVYVADLMALSLAAALKTAFVGESVADVTAPTVQTFVEGKMAEFLALKFTVGTAKAPGGWLSISINIIPGVLQVSVVAVEATSIYFIPINLDIEGIQASSSASGA